MATLYYDILVELFQYLEERDLAQIRQVNSLWYSAVEYIISKNKRIHVMDLFAAGKYLSVIKVANLTRNERPRLTAKKLLSAACKQSHVGMVKFILYKCGKHGFGGAQCIFDNILRNYRRKNKLKYAKIIEAFGMSNTIYVGMETAVNIRSVDLIHKYIMEGNYIDHDTTIEIIEIACSMRNMRLTEAIIDKCYKSLYVGAKKIMTILNLSFENNNSRVVQRVFYKGTSVAYEAINKLLLIAIKDHDIERINLILSYRGFFIKYNVFMLLIKIIPSGILKPKVKGRVDPNLVRSLIKCSCDKETKRFALEIAGIDYSYYLKEVKRITEVQNSNWWPWIEKK